MKESITLKNLKVTACPHFPANEVGDPVDGELQNWPKARWGNVE
jgi:hypothetical protein